MRRDLLWMLVLGLGCGGTSTARDTGGPDGATGADIPEVAEVTSPGDSAREVATDGAADLAIPEVPPGDLPDFGSFDAAGADVSTPPVDLASWCDRWGEAWCAFQVRCGLSVSAEACRRALETECPGAWLPALQEQGTVEFDAGQAAACLHALATLDCQQWWAEYREARDPFPQCRAALQGRTGAGGSCSWTLECPEHAWCDLAVCPGTCHSFPGEGDPCDLDRPCDPLRAICRNGTCAALPGPGEPCPEGWCVPPLLCEAGTCVRPVGPGEACRPSSGGCLEGLVCIEQGPGQGRCRTPGDVGTPCFRSLECGDPEGMRPLVCVSGRCREAPGPGEPCPDLVCTAAWCDAAAPTPLCNALPREGEACIQGLLCGEGLWCRQGRCVAKSPDGSVCEGPWQCLSGRCVAGTCRSPTDLPCPR